MRLPDDIRNLEGRKRLHRDDRLKTACHEAAHCVVSLNHRIPFIKVAIGDKVDTGAMYDETLKGQVVYEAHLTNDWGEICEAAISHIAGFVFERIVRPHDSDLVLCLTGAGEDWMNTMECVHALMPDFGTHEAEKFIKTSFVPRVRTYLIENWTTVMRVGEALSVAGELGYTQVKTLVGERR